MTILDDLLSLLSSPNPAANQSSSGVITQAPAPLQLPSTDASLLALLGSAGLIPNVQKLPSDVLGSSLPQDPSVTSTLDTPSKGMDVPTVVTQPDPILQALQQVNTNPAVTGEGAPISVAPRTDTNNVQPLGANVKGGVDRVNADTAGTGIRAVVDDNGNVTLTNLTGPTSTVNNAPTPDNKKIIKGGASYDAQGNALDANGAAMPSTIDQKNIATNVQSLMTALRNTTDGDTARGIMSQLTESLATEQAKFVQQAQTFATNKLQVPVLERQVAQSQSNDLITGGYGAAPSANTTKLLGLLDKARGDVDTEAKRYLQVNPSYVRLLAAGKNAEAEATRISKIDDRTNQLTLSKNLQLENKKQAQQDQLEAEAAGLTNEQKARIRVINPDLAQAPDTQLVQTLKKRQVKNDGYGAALEAPDADLPSLAAQNNPYASAILVAKEQSAGVNPEITNARIKELKGLTASKDALKTGIEIMIGSKDKKAVDAQMSSLNALSGPGSTKEQKAQASQIKLEAARTVLSQKVAQQFTGDVQQWAAPPPDIQAAIVDAKNKVGRSDMQSVYTSYLGDAQGPARKVLMDNFIKYATDSAKVTSKSQLGAVDPNRVRLQLETTETRTLLQRLGGLNVLDPRNSLLGQMFLNGDGNPLSNIKAPGQ